LRIRRRDDANRCDANPGASQPEDVRDLNSNVNLGTYYVAGIETVLLGDYRNDRFNPSDGWLTTYRVLYATPQLGSDFHFLRQDFLLGRYVQLAPRWVIAVGLRGAIFGFWLRVRLDQAAQVCLGRGQFRARVRSQ